MSDLLWTEKETSESWPAAGGEGEESSPANTPLLETERLILRRFREEDMEALLAIYGDEEANIFLPWFPIHSISQASELFEKSYRDTYRAKRGYAYAVCLKSDNIPIGYIHVNMDESHDLGYGLRREFWHRGIATEACRAVIEQLEKDGIEYVTATHDVENPRSGQVMKRLGMQYCYSYEEQWQPKDKRVIFRLYQLNLDGRDERVYRRYWTESERRFVEELG